MKLEHSAEIAAAYDKSRALSASVLDETVNELGRCTMVEWGEEEGIQKIEEGIQKIEE